MPRRFGQDLEGYKVLVCGDINSLPCPAQTAGCDFASIRIIAPLSLPVISSLALIALRARSTRRADYSSIGATFLTAPVRPYRCRRMHPAGFRDSGLGDGAIRSVHHIWVT